MQARPSSSLHLPSFLHGPLSAIHREVEAEGRRCAQQYARDGSLPPPQELLPVAPDLEVFTYEVSDFQPEAPAWRLYGVSDVLMSLDAALKEQTHYRILREAYEKTFRETPWGALFYATGVNAPHGAHRTGLRLAAVVRFWDSLQHDRYVHKRLGELLNLEQLMLAECGWALEAWCPEGGASLPLCFERASERLLRATREECVQTFLRLLPRMRQRARHLAHPDVVTDPAFCREHLALLDEASFDRLSAVCPAWVIQRLTIWDRQLGRQ